MLCARLIPRINASRDGRSAVVVKVVMQRAVASAEALLFKEEWVVEKGESIEDIEVGLGSSALVILVPCLIQFFD